MGSSDHLLSFLVDRDRVLEIGIGRRPDLANRLQQAGVDVVAIDVDQVPVPEGVHFLRRDVHEVDLDEVRPIDAMYAQNLPPELHTPTVALADRADVPCWFTTLGTEFPIVPVRIRSDDAGAIYEYRPGSNKV